MEKENLIKLVQQAKAGDAEALGLLYAEYRNVAFSVAMRYTKSRALSDDIVQETFITVIEKIADLKAPEAFPSWLKTITYRQCTNHDRKAENIHELLAIENEESFSVLDTEEERNASFIPDEALDQKELKETILSMVDELPDVQRSALYMFYFDDLPLKVIAQVQGVSINTATTRLDRGRKAVKGSIERYEKKHGIRLHSIAFFPFFKWLLSGTEENMSASSAATVAQNVSAATGVAIAAPEATAAGVTATTATAIAATTSTAASAGIGAKIAAMPIVAKIVSGIVAASIVVGMPIAISQLRDKPQDILNETEATEWMSEVEETQQTEPTQPVEIDVQPFYQVVLDQYKAAMENNFYYDENRMPIDTPDDQHNYIAPELQSESRAYENFTVCYSLVDLNADGRKELFIGAGANIDDIRLFDLLTLKDKSPVKVFQDDFGYRTNLFVLSDLSLRIESSGSAFSNGYDYYMMESGKITPTCLGKYVREDERYFYYENDNASGTEITKDEFLAATNFDDAALYQFQWEPIKVRENLINDFTAAEQRTANVFMSNFVEQSFGTYPTKSDFDLLRFALQHCKDNPSSTNQMTYETIDDITYEVISSHVIDAILERFFGVSITHRSFGEDRMYGIYEYKNGNYYTEAADGELCRQFAIVRRMFQNDDGTYTITYDVYHAEEWYGGYIEDVSPYYGLSPDEVNNYPELILDGSGEAIIKDYIKSNGTATYQLVSMEQSISQ